MIAYRDGTPADADLMSELGSTSFAETFGHLYAPENLDVFLRNHSPENWARELGDPVYAVRIAEDDGVPAGFCKLGPPSLPFEVQGPAAELRQLYVLKPWHGAGIAATLMEWALERARAGGAEELLLSVFVDNHRARRFYARYGFEQVGTYDFMVGDHADLDLIMRLEL